jgi:hypothetical protein
MNEKFKQLALEAKMGTADFDAGSYYVATPDRMQQFAESIVMECTKILADNGEFRGCVIIGKHFRVFGVEE